MNKRINRKLRKLFSATQCLVMDVDGVLTSGELFYGEAGEMIKIFHAHDGFGLKCLHDVGIKTAIITARKSPIVSKRAHELGINYIFQGAKQKDKCLEALVVESGVLPENMAYIGDDVPDIPALEAVNLPICVPNASIPVKDICAFETQSFGGFGAVREVCDLILSYRPDA